MAQMCVDEELEKDCYNLLQFPISATNSPYFLSAKPESVNNIFTRNDLKDSPTENLIYALECYIEANVHQDPDVKNKLLSSIQNINFEIIDPRRLLSTTLLTDEEKLPIYKKIK